MIQDDFRKTKLLNWLRISLNLPIIQCESASSDASFRRYFRISLPEQQLIVMDAPPDKENIPQFIKVAELLRGADVKVPTIYHQNLDDGFLVLEDFGSQSFLGQLNHDNAPTLYDQAMSSLFKLQTNISFQNVELPHYDASLLMLELGIFEEWFLNQYLGVEIPASLWEAVRSLLVNSALEQPLTCVHRDYHSRNLMVQENNLLGVIDFQDAVFGPITYDLVSLLRDCYIEWPQSQIEQWAAHYHQKLQEKGFISADLSTFMRWFDLMGLQRHLKAIGIFSRLKLRDGKPGYLKDIPRTLNYVLAQSQKFPELSDFLAYLQQRVLPKLPAQ